MKIFKEGEKSKGPCSKCKKIRPTTFKVSSVPFSSGRGIVNDILVTVCDHCRAVVSIPQQSTPRIREALNSKKHSIEVRVPIQLLDILLLASDQFGMGHPDQLKDSLLRYYIALAESDKKISVELKNFSDSEMAAGSGQRLSLKVNEVIYQKFAKVIERTKLSKTQVIKGLILQINEDILQKRVKKRIEELEKVMWAAA